jgi:hypothetical protein
LGIPDIVDDAYLRIELFLKIRLGLSPLLNLLFLQRTDECKHFLFFGLRQIVKLIDDLCNKGVFLGRPHRVAVPLSVPIEFHQALKFFVDSVEKVVIHEC